MTPDDVGWLAGLSGLPVVAKGVQRADDAVRCIEAGAAAIVVSNHGGRQLDDAPATADILPEIVDAVAGRVEVYVDGGIRRAPDVAKALALGARAVMVGRPSLWALAAGGADRRGVAPALVRERAQAHDGPVRDGHGGKSDRPVLGPAGDRIIDDGWTAMTTVAAMVAARAEEDRGLGVLDAAGRWTWRQSVAEGAARLGAGPGRCAATDRFTSGCCSPTGPSTSSGSTWPRLAGAAIVGVNPTRRAEVLAADIRSTDCALIVTDAEGATPPSRVSHLVWLPITYWSRDPSATSSSWPISRRTTAPEAEQARDLVAHAGDVAEDALFQLDLHLRGPPGHPRRCGAPRVGWPASPRWAAPEYGYGPDDVCYCPMPLFHWPRPHGAVGTRRDGRCGHRRPGPLQRVGIPGRCAAFGATKFSYVGKAIAYILATPERPDDAENTLRSAFGTEASVRYSESLSPAVRSLPHRGLRPERRRCGHQPGAGHAPRGTGEAGRRCRSGRHQPRNGRRVPARGDLPGGRLLNAGEATGEIVNRSGRGKFEGYYRHESAENVRLRNGR